MTTSSTDSTARMLGLAALGVAASALSLSITYFAFHSPRQSLPEDVVQQVAKACADSKGCKAVRPVLFTKDAPLHRPAVGFLVRLEGSPSERRSATLALEAAAHAAPAKIAFRPEADLEVQ